MTDIVITADEWDKLFIDATKVGGMTARKYAGLVDPEDVSQSIMERFVDSERSARKMLDAYGKDKRIAFKGMLLMGSQIAAQEINAHRQAHGNFTYTPDYVRRLLAQGVISTEEKTGSVFDAQVNTLSTGRKSKKDHVERVNYTDKVDLDKGFAKLSRDHRTVIVRKYVAGETNFTNAERMRLTRAVDALTMHMNGHRVTSSAAYSGTGSRSVMSNAIARAITGNNYDG
ncbi:hypothetical protein ACFYYS_00410 [Streptomyces sp. NPDC002120]|uniref:hypothetical protein n=1 Tax=Streptomyces sp. NPDC002120 TaxID=3364631 RepID=UPI003694513D